MAAAESASAAARGGGGRTGAGAYRGGSAHYGTHRGHYGQGRHYGHGGHYGHRGYDHHRRSYGVYFGAGYYWPRYYSYPYYAPYTYAPYTYVEPAPQYYAAPAQEQSYVWYYCRPVNTYYPYVTQCQAAWEPVQPYPPPGSDNLGQAQPPVDH